MIRTIKLICCVLLLPLACLGLIFSGMLFHEGIHVYDSFMWDDIEPSSVCWDLNLKQLGSNLEKGSLFFHVNHNVTGVKTWTAFEVFTEKRAYTFQAVWDKILFVVVGLVYGCLVTLLILRKFKKIE